LYVLSYSEHPVMRRARCTWPCHKVIAEEGAGALLTGLGATAFGYFVQGWFKFGGFEFFKVQANNKLSPQEAGLVRNRGNCSKRPSTDVEPSFLE